MGRKELNQLPSSFRSNLSHSFLSEIVCGNCSVGAHNWGLVVNQLVASCQVN